MPSHLSFSIGTHIHTYTYVYTLKYTGGICCYVDTLVLSVQIHTPHAHTYCHVLVTHPSFNSPTYTQSCRAHTIPLHILSHHLPRQTVSLTVTSLPFIVIHSSSLPSCLFAIHLSSLIQECSKYGPVQSCVTHEEPDAVRIFIRFETQESAVRAFRDMNGRLIYPHYFCS